MIRTRKPTHRTAHVAERALTGILFLEGVLALIGGAMLMAAPSGALLQMPAAWLQGTPFGSYLIPGVILTLALGVLPVTSAWALWRRRPVPALRRLERVLGYDAAWLGSFASGLAIAIWIVTQVAMVRTFHPMQAFIFALGAAVVILTLLPSVRRAHVRRRA